MTAPGSTSESDVDCEVLASTPTVMGDPVCLAHGLLGRSVHLQPNGSKGRARRGGQIGGSGASAPFSFLGGNGSEDELCDTCVVQHPGAGPEVYLWGDGITELIFRPSMGGRNGYENVYH